MKSDIADKYFYDTQYSRNCFRLLIVLMILLIAASLYGSCVYGASKKPKKLRWDSYTFSDYYKSGADTYLYWDYVRNIKKFQIYQKVGSKWKFKKKTSNYYYKFRGQYGKTYYFKVRGVNGKKKGTFSKVLKVKIKKPKYVAGDVAEISTINGQKEKIKVTEYEDTWQQKNFAPNGKSLDERDNSYRSVRVIGNVIGSDMRFWKIIWYENGKVNHLTFGRSDNAIYRGESGYLSKIVDGEDGPSEDDMHTNDYSILFNTSEYIQGCVYNESAEICWSLDGIEPYYGQEDRVFSVARDSGGNVIKQGICPGFLDPDYPYYDNYEIFRYKTAGTIKRCNGKVAIIRDQDNIGRTGAKGECWMKAFVNGKLSFEKYEYNYVY